MNNIALPVTLLAGENYVITPRFGGGTAEEAYHLIYYENDIKVYDVTLPYDSLTEEEAIQYKVNSIHNDILFSIYIS